MKLGACPPDMEPSLTACPCDRYVCRVGSQEGRCPQRTTSGHAHQLEQAPRCLWRYGFTDFKQIMPPALDLGEARRTRSVGAGVREVAGIGATRYVLSINKDDEARNVSIQAGSVLALYYVDLHEISRYLIVIIVKFRDI